MIVCTYCDGKGRIMNPASFASGSSSVRCEQCDGAGVLIDPQLERLIEAVEKVAKELADIRYIGEQFARGGGR